ncbi:MAG: helix-hairpin-helix domain-containing protein [Nitrosomonadales bacterium]|nr:helix-hairpin-helix domain-containing protein [Nitrosomonadales bacterium]
MKKLLLILLAFFAFSGMALAAVNLNTATREELDGVKGIGPVKAQAIIEYRTKNGLFKSVDDLKNVKGFGDKTVAKMRSELTVDGAVPAKAEKKADAKKAEAKKEEPKAEAKEAEPAKAGSKPAKADAKKEEKPARK